MKYRIRMTLAMLCVSAAMLCTAALPAQAQSDADETKVKTSEDLLHSAGFIKKKLAELLVAMSDVEKLLEKTEPDVAAILKRTVEHAQREDVSGKIEDVIRDIRQGLDQAAQMQQGEVIDDLTQMLRILEGGVVDLTKAEKRLAELLAIRDRLKKNLQRQELEEKRTRPAANLEDLKKQSQALAQSLQGIIDKQKKLKTDTNKLGSCNPQLKKLGELLEAIEELAAKQKILNETTEQAGLSRLPILAEVQKRLAGRTKTLPKELADVQVGPDKKDIQAAAEYIEAAGEQMKKAIVDLEKSDKLQARNSQEKTLADLQVAAKLLRKKLQAEAGDTSAGKLAKPQGQLGNQTRQLAGKEAQLAEQAGIDPKSLSDKKEKKEISGNLSQASDNMNQAAEKLTAQQPAAAEARQEKALAELQEKLRRVAKLRRRALAQAEKKLNAAEQQRIAEDLKKLADRMKEGDGKKFAAGGKAVAAAGKCAGAAAGKMSECDAKSANSDQKKAVDQLRKAQEELSAEIAQMERRIRAEKLASVEERLAKILEEQKACNTQTMKTYKDRGQGEPAYDRQARQTLVELAKAEGGLAEEVQAVRDMLKQDGSTVVFPEILREVQEDIAAVQKQLSGLDPGLLTQATQEDIVLTLEELISAVRKELSKGHGRAKGGGSGSGKGGGKAPLVPPIAELRMLRLQQLRVNSGTRRADRMVKNKQLTGDAANAQYEKLSKRQKRVMDIAKKMAAKSMDAAGTDEKVQP